MKYSGTGPSTAWDILGRQNLDQLPEFIGVGQSFRGQLVPEPPITPRPASAPTPAPEPPVVDVEPEDDPWIPIDDPSDPMADVETNGQPLHPSEVRDALEKRLLIARTDTGVASFSTDANAIPNLLAMASVESGFTPDIDSLVGQPDYGMFQLRSTTTSPYLYDRRSLVGDRLAQDMVNKLSVYKEFSDATKAWPSQIDYILVFWRLFCQYAYSRGANIRAWNWVKAKESEDEAVLAYCNARAQMFPKTKPLDVLFRLYSAYSSEAGVRLLVKSGEANLRTKRYLQALTRFR